MNISKNTIICHSCAEDVHDEYVSCQGFCNAVFHLRCCGASPELLKEVTSHRQMFWLCKSCSHLMVDLRHRRSVQCAYEAGQELSLSHHNRIVEQLKTEILSELKAELKTNFEKLISSSSLTPSRGSGSVNLGSRRLFGTNVAPASGTKNGTPAPNVGTKSPTLRPEGLVAGTEEPRFWLYLSRISRRVTEEQISKLATNRLGVTDLKVTRLVAKGRDVSRMKFISFKIGMHISLKTKALTQSLWPEGLVVREFEERSGEKFWEPAGAVDQIQPSTSAMNLNQHHDGPHRPWADPILPQVTPLQPSPPQLESTPTNPKASSPMITSDPAREHSV